ncbi:MAG: DsrE family protein [Gammaproteobacteria bacterium]|nr:DsrE family protein [Gammaproteobacteria bacterium]
MKIITTRILTVLIIGLSLLMTSTVYASDRYGKQKVVYHINYDDPKMQAGALRNIQNHINAVGAENLDLKVVLHGNGLAMLLEPDSLQKLTKFKYANANETMTAKIDTLKNQGVTFNVCANTISGRNVDRETDLYNVSAGDIVPSGVAEVARLQAMGYAYIKP